MDIDLNARGPKRVEIQKEKRTNDFFSADTIQGSASDASKKTITQLKNLYKKTIMPIEQKFGLYKFCLPTDGEIEDAELEAKPMVLLIGQYSTGKSTFVRHLVGGDFPGMHIGPEPTTDKFMTLVHGADYDEDDEEEDEIGTDNYDKSIDKVAASKGKILKGNFLTVTPELPFQGLASFGTGFLSNFIGSVSNYPLLKHVTLVDTPGVLSGEKQRISRKYNFSKVTKWFADRSDLILLLFDAHKLDISDELKNVIETIRPQNDDKIRCVLNKADGVTKEQLVRVYGSLMWSMGQVVSSPEVVRVYTGSFWEEPLMHDDFESMFERDELLLINELMNLPKSSAERKVNDMVKRVRMIKVHICILAYVKNKMPRLFGKENARKDIIENLDKVFDAVRLEYKLSEGDMPDVKLFAKCLDGEENFSNFVAVDRKTLRALDDILLNVIPNMMRGVGGITNPSENMLTSSLTQKMNRSTRAIGGKVTSGYLADVGTSSKRKSSSTLVMLTKLVIVLALLFIFVFIISKDDGLKNFISGLYNVPDISNEYSSHEVVKTNSEDGQEEL